MTSVLVRSKKRIAVLVFAVASTLIAVGTIVHAGDVTYEYDDAGRLKRVTRSSDNKRTTYKLDAAGNRTDVVRALVTPPTVPGAFSATPVSATRVNLAWTVSTVTQPATVTSYKIYRSDLVQPIVVTPGSATSYADLSVVGLTNYTYRITSVSSDNVESAKSSPVAVSTPSPPDTIPPSAPGPVSFSNVTYNSMTVSWGPASDNIAVAGYDYRVNGGTWTNAGNVLSVALASLTPSTVYTVDVRAKDGAQNLSTTLSSNSVTTAAAPPPGTFTFGNSPAGVDESVGTVTFLVQRVGGSYGPASIRCKTADYTALAGTSYTAVDQILTWANGDSATKSCNVSVTNDAIYRGTVVFDVNFSQATGATLATPVLFEITITDNDIPSFSLSGPATVVEGGIATYTVTKTGASVFSHNVGYYTMDGSASSQEPDYTATSGTLTFAPGEYSKTFAVATVQDPWIEGDQTFGAAIGNATNGATVPLQTAVITTTIIDDETGSFAYPGTSASVTEGPNVTLTFPVTRMNGVYGAASVVCSTIDGSATSSSDFTYTSTTLRWADHEAGTKTCSIPITDDSTHEPSKYFTVRLSSATSGMASSDPYDITVILSDDDAPPPIPPPPVWTGGWENCTVGCPTRPSDVLTWASGGGTVDYYVLEYKDSTWTFEFTVAYSGPNTWLDETGTFFPGNYTQQRVKACNGSGCSDFGPIIQPYEPNIYLKTEDKPDK